MLLRLCFEHGWKWKVHYCIWPLGHFEYSLNRARRQIIYSLEKLGQNAPSDRILAEKVGLSQSLNSRYRLHIIGGQVSLWVLNWSDTRCIIANYTPIVLCIHLYNCCVWFCKSRSQFNLRTILWPMVWPRKRFRQHCVQYRCKLVSQRLFFQFCAYVTKWDGQNVGWHAAAFASNIENLLRAMLPRVSRPLACRSHSTGRCICGREPVAECSLPDGINVQYTGIHPSGGCKSWELGPNHLHEGVQDSSLEGH